MKQDKALLKLDGINLLQRQFDILERHVGIGRVFVSGERPEFPHVKDLDAGLGPLEGLRSVCLHLSRLGRLEPMLVVPVDMPFMTDAGLSRLLNQSGSRDVTKFFGRQMPIVINVPSRVLQIIETIKAQSDSSEGSRYSFKNLFENIQVQELPPEPEHFFANLNTPEDWNAALS